MQDVLNALWAELDIPISYYELARERYKSIGKHLERDDSELAQSTPHIYPQGSFRYGTVVRPITEEGEYDLDIVCEMTELTKGGTTQKALKESTGRELVLYATGNSMNSKPKEGRKCWHLKYADEVKFHIDVLPAVPGDPSQKDRIAEALRDMDPTGKLAQFGIAITDNRCGSYSIISGEWPSSNPRGYGQWFEARIRSTADARMRSLVEAGSYRKIDDVPAYEWKTPLQQGIQILKRHRDVMFEGNPDSKPISMIITTLAARAYKGESTLSEALPAIIAAMPGLVHPSGRRVPNPVDPQEDFADKWKDDPELEYWFREWMKQVARDVSLLGTTRDLAAHLKMNFEVQLAQEERARIIIPAAAAAAAPSVQIKDRPRPYGSAPE